jgi:hypothetical protein
MNKLARAYSQNLEEKTSGRPNTRETVHQAQGKSERRKLFGVTEGEEATISRMKQLAAEGLNYTHIANGFKTQSGRRWLTGTVRCMLAK